ncbi:MAG: potassium-transporting ATPase subunit KdpC [Acidobacteria bacterium]|nr:potassium-transporting ATPase subunit KdpC [Acidobacteriota bacterium]
MIKEFMPGLRLMLVFTVLTGLMYTGLVTAICQVLIPDRANGSLIRVGDQVIGSELIGQVFTKPEYFHPRPSAAGSDGYDAWASSGSNLGPTSQKLADRIKVSVEAFRQENPDYRGPIPADLLTASASGLDPHISPDSARAQAPRVAKARGRSLSQVEQLIKELTENPDLGLLGDPRVNVLRLNLALNERFAERLEEPEGNAGCASVPMADKPLDVSRLIVYSSLARVFMFRILK